MDSESLSPTQRATQQRVDWESQTLLKGAHPKAWIQTPYPLLKGPRNGMHVKIMRCRFIVFRKGFFWPKWAL